MAMTKQSNPTPTWREALGAVAALGTILLGFAVLVTSAGSGFVGKLIAILAFTASGVIGIILNAVIVNHD